MNDIPEPIAANNIEDNVAHGYVDNNGVKIHYASMGSGPLMIMIHGFPDYWFTWRHQMLALSPHYQTVAIDLRGYNLSDKPQGGENYAMPYLLSDVQAVIRHFGVNEAIIVGHDWGGVISWQFAIHLPAMTQKLIILNIPHPSNMNRELVHNPQQQKNSQYARDFQREGAHLSLTPEKLSAWVTDPLAREHYLEAFRRSDLEAMLHYYKQNFPKEPYMEASSTQAKVQAPVLEFHGLKDEALLSSGLNDTWNWLEKDLTLVTIPNAGHFVQHDASDLVTRTTLSWLSR